LAFYLHLGIDHLVPPPFPQPWINGKYRIDRFSVSPSAHRLRHFPRPPFAAEVICTVSNRWWVCRSVLDTVFSYCCWPPLPLFRLRLVPRPRVAKSFFAFSGHGLFLVGHRVAFLTAISAFSDSLTSGFSVPPRAFSFMQPGSFSAVFNQPKVRICLPLHLPATSDFMKTRYSVLSFFPYHLC